MASYQFIILLIALNFLAIGAKPVINEITSRQGEQSQLPSQQGPDQNIPDELRELFGDIYDYDFQFPSPPAPLTPEELNNPPSPLLEEDYVSDYDTPQFQSNFPDTESRSNTVDSTVLDQSVPAERISVQPPINSIHSVFEFNEGESQSELPDLVPHPGISQYPEFTRGQDINLQPGGVSSTHSYESKGKTDELPTYVQSFNIPLPLEDADRQDKFSPSFDEDEVLTTGLSVEDAVKYIQEEARLEEERSNYSVSGRESPNKRVSEVEQIEPTDREYPTTEFGAAPGLEEEKVQSEALEIEDAIKYAKLKASEKLGTYDGSEIKISEQDKNIAFEEMFRISLNFLSDIEESESNSLPKTTDLELYTQLIDAMTKRFIDGNGAEESESKSDHTSTEYELKEKNDIMAEEIINLFSQINDYESKKASNLKDGKFQFVSSVIPDLDKKISKLQPIPVAVNVTSKEEINNVTTSIREQKLIHEKPNGRRGYDGQISSSVSQTESLERIYPENDFSAPSAGDQLVVAQPIDHDVRVSQTETIERIHPYNQAQTHYTPEATPISYQYNGYVAQNPQEGHIIGAPFTLIQVPQTEEQPKGFFRTLSETGSVIKAGAAAFRKKLDIFRTIFKKGSSRDYENSDVHLAVVPAYIAQVEPNAHPVEVIEYPRSSLSTSVDSSVSTSVNYQKLDAPPKGLQRIDEDEYKENNFDIKESVIEKAAPLLSSKLSPPSEPAGPDFDIRSHQEVSGHGIQVDEEEKAGRFSTGIGFKTSALHDTVNGVYHSVRDGYDTIRDSISRFTSFFTPSFTSSEDEVSQEQVVAPLQVHHQQPLHYQPVYLAVQHQEEEDDDHKTGFLGKLKKKFKPWL